VFMNKLWNTIFIFIFALAEILCSGGRRVFCPFFFFLNTILILMVSFFVCVHDLFVWIFCGGRVRVELI
jgi:hypothetical protein